MKTSDTMKPEGSVTRPGMISLHQSLEAIPKSEFFQKERHQWNTNEEIASYLISFEKHKEWLSTEVKIRPRSGTMLLYSRKTCRYRQDGYYWKKRRDGKTAREDHMKLKVQGVECLYGCYVHSAVLPTFHRRCYWLLQNPDIVLVHYLNTPYEQDNKLYPISHYIENKQWTKEELIKQLKPMFFSQTDADVTNEAHLAISDTVENIVEQLLDMQKWTQTSDTCTCYSPQAGTSDGHVVVSCPKHRIISPKTDSLITTSNDVIANTSPGAILNNSIQTTLADVVNAGQQSAPTSFVMPNNESVNSIVLNVSELQNGNRVLILNSSSLKQPTVSLNCSCTNGSQQKVTQELKSDMNGLCDNQNTLNSHCFTLASRNSFSSLSAVSSSSMTGLSNNMKNENSEQVSITNGISPTFVTPSSSSFGSISMPGTSSQTSDHPVPISMATDMNCGSPVMNGASHDDMELFDGNLSHLITEDIQKTLSENLPVNSVHKLNSDFQTPDDFFNLDMLSDFPDFFQNDLTDNEASSGQDEQSIVTPITIGTTTSDAHARCDTSIGNILTISDFSPEWSYPEGGTKVLVTGPWYSPTSPYICMFDSVSAPASLVQTGVLRCFCPAHEPGLVTLQVACEGCIISNSVVFEYKSRPASLQPSNHSEWLALDEDKFKMSILARLEQLEQRLTAISNTGAGQTSQQVPYNTSTMSFEDRLVAFVQRLSTRPWLKPSEIQSLRSTYRGMNTLHLATALNYTRLVHTLIRWRCESPSLVLENEVDAVNGDDMMCTPLMWACALNYRETALLLYQWNSAALSVPNAANQLPLQVARERQHIQLAEQIESMENARVSCNSQLSRKDGSACSTRSSSIASEDANQATASSLYCDAPSDSKMSDESRMLSKVPEHIQDARKHVTECETGTRRTRLSKRASLEGVDQARTETKQRRTPDPELSSDRMQGLDEQLNDLSSSVLMEVEPIQPDSHFQDYRVDQRSSVMMDTDGVPDRSSPLYVIGLSDDECENVAPSSLHRGTSDGSGGDKRVLTLAEQIIAAIPERIKNVHVSAIGIPRPGEVRELDYPELDDDEDFGDASYKMRDIRTTVTTMSPTSSIQSPSPPPTAAEFRGFFNASGKLLERNFAELTLSDKEQRELYEAAKIIQNAYRQYKGRRRQQEQERAAAILIQSYYRRYKQYAFFKKMTRAAVLIQSQYRTYRHHKHLKQMRQNASSVLQQQSVSSNTTNIGLGSSGYHDNVITLKRQQAAARKIQRFMRQSKNRLQQERAKQAAISTKRERTLALTSY